jgi:hypothetical protein
MSGWSARERREVAAREVVERRCRVMAVVAHGGHQQRERRGPEDGQRDERPRQAAHGQAALIGT